MNHNGLPKPRNSSQTFCLQTSETRKDHSFQTIQNELETWLSSTVENIPHFIEEEFRSFLKCGILAYGFARAHCKECGHDSLIAFSCKGRGICPSCNTRHMAQIAAIPEGCRLGAVTFIQRFGKALNPHFHFHSCVIDGVFDKKGKFYPIDTLSIDEIHVSSSFWIV